MKWINDIKIGTKMLIGFIIVALFSAVVGFVGMANIKSLNNDNAVLYSNMTVMISDISDMSTLFQRIRVYSRDMIYTNDQESIDKYAQELQKLRTSFGEVIADYEKLDLPADVKASYQKFKAARIEYVGYLEQLVTLAKANKDAEALTLLSNMTSSENTGIAELENMKALTLKNAKALSQQNSSTANSAYIQLAILMFICLILAVFIGIAFTKLISKRLIELVTQATRVAHGDLFAEFPPESKDEIGKLAFAFKRLAINVNRILFSMSKTADEVTASSNQLSESSLSLSQGTTEQASAIEQLTASLEQISAQTKNNADYADTANQLTEEARVNAANGNAEMKEMLSAMEEINSSSNNISKIIKVIDEIAFQTNILALNAAVEAARAGQHGKGFAVVAEEVRNLAARSAKAARETTEMIEGSIKKVEHGTKIANQTAHALDKIVDGITKVAGLVGNIAVASKEQATGISQINQGIMQVSNVIQTNSATAEESAATSAELSKYAVKLKQQVIGIKIKPLSDDDLKEALKYVSAQDLENANKLLNKPGASSQSAGVPVASGGPR